MSQRTVGILPQLRTYRFPECMRIHIWTCRHLTRYSQSCLPLGIFIRLGEPVRTGYLFAKPRLPLPSTSSLLEDMANSPQTFPNVLDVVWREMIYLPGETRSTQAQQIDQRVSTEFQSSGQNLSYRCRSMAYTSASIRSCGEALALLEVFHTESIRTPIIINGATAIKPQRSDLAWA